MVNVVTHIKEHSTKYPDKKAVFYKRWYTYSELDTLVDGAAASLIELGAKKDSGIALIYTPSIDALVLIFASLRVGSYFIPFNDSQPKDLIEKLIEESGAALVLCDSKNQSKSTQARIFSLEEMKPGKKAPATVEGKYSYQLFTSGTTGKQKTVLMTMPNLEYIVDAMNADFPCKSEDTLIWTTSWTFDVSIVQLFGFLKNAGKLIIPDISNKEAIIKLPELVEQHQVTHVNLVPTVLAGVFSVWTENEVELLRKQLKFLMLAGEEFKYSLAIFIKNKFPNVRILNLYGPTEATVYATTYEVKGNEPSEIPIGRALLSADVFIVDKNLKRIAPGEEGEIVIAGKGISAGYSNNAELTKDKFVMIENKRCYLTGDIGFINKDGMIVFKGRRDRQVQIHGIRVELQEIEANLDHFFSIPGHVYVLFKDPSLHLFYKGEESLKEKISKFLTAHYPAYLIPLSMTAVKEFPVTSSGKIDERALMELKTDVKKVLDFSQSDEEVTTKLLAIFNLDKDSVHAELSDLGLDSLELMIAQTKIEKEFKKKIPETLLISSGKVIDIVNFLKAANGGQEKSEDGTPVNGAQLAETFHHLWRNQFKEAAIVNKFSPHSLQRLYYYDNFESVLTLRMNLGGTVKTAEVAQTLTAMIKHHELLHSILVKEGEDFSVGEVNLGDEMQIPLLELNGAISNTLANQIQDQLVEDVKKIVHDKILHTPIILKGHNHVEIIWVFSHMIADQYSIYELKRQIAGYLTSKKLPEKRPYSDFIKFQERQCTGIDFLNHDLTKKLSSLNVNSEYEIEKSDEIRQLTISMKSSASFEEKVAKICHEVGQYLADFMGMEKFAISTILNIRKFQEANFENTFGDCHATLVVPFIKSESVELFNASFVKAMDLYNRGASPYFYAFKNFPEMSDEEAALEKAYDTYPIVGINYLGFIDKENVADVDEGLRKSKKALMSFPGKRIYVTSFEDDQGVIYVKFLTHPKKK